jgi:putative two-component system response regulator
MMGAEGFACAVAASVDEARSHVESAEPDLVLLDVGLPGESGLTLAREVAARDTRPAVIMVSGHDDAEIAGVALDAGAFGYITKPFRRNDLVIAVRNALRRRRDEIEQRSQQALLEERVVERTAVADDALTRLRVAHEETVLRLSKAIEYRDPETGSHIERMSHYCALLAVRFGLDPDMVRVASRLHDVGKIAVADSILHKPGPLTPAERKEMERHAEIGYGLLRRSRSELLECAATIAWTHHERWDGSGYPRGLVGEQIPIVGRIAGVADVFDALITDRVYRPAVPVDQAIAMITAQRGRQFDPAVVDGFLEEAAEVEAIIARFEAQPATRHEAVEEHAAIASASNGAVLAAVQPIEPPREPLERVGECLRDAGARMAREAAARLYEEGRSGWFATDAAAPAIREWLSQLARSCDSGRYELGVAAGASLMRRAQLHGATLLERHGFLERFADVAMRSLSQAGLSRTELGDVRRLLAAHQQRLLDSFG